MCLVAAVAEKDRLIDGSRVFWVVLLADRRGRE